MNKNVTNESKGELSIIFNPFENTEKYNTLLYLHKSRIAVTEKNGKYKSYVQVALERDDKSGRLQNPIINSDYGTFLISFLNADFSTAENAYYSFFIYYGIEGTIDDTDLKETNTQIYNTRYASTKDFLNYYNETFKLIKEKYIEYQHKLKDIVDYTYSLNRFKDENNIDKYAKFVSYSIYSKITTYFKPKVDFSIYDEERINSKHINNLQQINNFSNLDIFNMYSSNSNLALGYIALMDLVKFGKRNLSICQNCGRYYLQYSGKEVYCDLQNADGSPSCKSYASRKAYDERVTEDIAESTYKREYQRRITQVYRADKKVKTQTKMEFTKWKMNARIVLKQYRDNKITSEEFCEWIEKNK